MVYINRRQNTTNKQYIYTCDSNWSAQVSQHINVPQQNDQYLLRVIAKKEGIGNGYVKISDYTTHVKTLIFTSSDSTHDTMWDGSLGYVTKTMHIMPQTKQIGCFCPSPRKRGIRKQSFLKRKVAVLFKVFLLMNFLVLTWLEYRFP